MAFYRPWAETLEDRTLPSGAGVLDTTFGQGGSVTTNLIGSGTDLGKKVLVGGNEVYEVGTTDPQGNSSIAIARLNLADGSLDPTYGHGGQVVLANNSGGVTIGGANSAALQADGKLVVSGDHGVVRLNTDGSLDTTFHQTGYVTSLTNGSLSLNSPWHIAIQGNQIVVAGTSFNSSTLNDFIVARLNSDGSLDQTFGTNGVTSADFTGGSDSQQDIAVDSDGSIVVAGTSTPKGQSTTSIAIARFTASGTLDTGFNGTGTALFRPHSADSQGFSVAIQSDHKILVGGTSSGFGGQILRCNADGTLDTAFGNSGIAATIQGNYASTMAVQGDSKILLAEAGPLVARLNADGSPDYTFNAAGGRASVTVTTNGQVAGVALAGDGSILAAGYTSSADTGNDFLLAKYNTDGSTASSFGINGSMTLDFVSSRPSSGYGLAIDASGRILQVGSTTTFAGTALVTRVSPDGVPDTSFGTQGNVVIQGVDAGNGIAVQGDGRIVVVGATGIARLNNDGSLDTTFNQTGEVNIPAALGITSTRCQDVAMEGAQIVVAGEYYDSSGNPAGLFAARFNSDGSLDPTFGTNGKTVTNFGYQTPGSRYTQPLLYHSLAIDSDGSLVLAGNTVDNSASTSGIGLAKLTAGGQFDTSFNATGWLVTGFVAGATQNYPSAIAVQPDHKIVIGGQYNGSAALTRFNTDGSHDLSFGGGTGVVFAYIPGAIGIEADGKIVTASPPLSRYNADGSTDYSFGPNESGHAVFPGSGTALAFTADNKILVEDVGSGAFDLERFTAVATTPPTITRPGDQSSNESQSIGLQVSASGAVSFTASDLPLGLSINNSTGLIFGTINRRAAGSYSVQITASNAVGSASISFTWTVADTTPPDLTKPANQTNIVGDTVSLTVAATDADSFTATGLPTGLTIDNTGKIAGTIGLHAVGSYVVTITATDAGHSSTTQFTWTVNPGPVASLSITGPSTPTAGAADPVTVMALDSAGNLVTTYAGAIHFTSSDPSATLPSDYTFTAADAGVHTFTQSAPSFPAIFKTSGTVTITATDTAKPSITGTATVTVTPGPVDHFTVTGFPSEITAGQNGSTTVSAFDAYGNLDKLYTGSVIIGGQGPFSFSASDQGVRTFSVALTTAGPTSLLVYDSSLPSVQGEQLGITVDPATTAQLVVSGFPVVTVAGVAHSFTLTAEDAYGNQTPAYHGTIHFTSTDTLAQLPTNFQFPGNSAVQSFQASLTTSTYPNPTPWNLAATDTSNSSITGQENNVTVLPAAASRFVIVNMPPLVTINQPVQQINVIAYDALGNVATGYRGTVHFTSSDPQAALPGDYTFTASDGGEHFFQNFVTFKNDGTPQTVTVADTATPTVQGTASVNVNLPATHFVVQVVGASQPYTSVGGQQFALAILPEDQFGNVVPNYPGGTLHISSSDPQAQIVPFFNTQPIALPTDTDIRPYGAIMYLAGIQSLTVTDSLTQLTGTLNIAITPAPAVKLALSGLPTSTIAGTTYTVTVTAEDAYGNAAPNAAGTIVHFASSDPQSKPPADYTFQSGDNGSYSFPFAFLTAGTQTLSASDAALALPFVSSPGITVAPAATSQLILSSTATPITAGKVFSFSITAEDAFGNVTPAYTGTVALTSDDSLATLPGTVIFQSSNLGVVSGLSATFVRAGRTGVTMTDTGSPGINGSTGLLVAPAPASSFVLTELDPLSVTAGDTIEGTLTVEDPYGNIVTGYTGTVHFTSSDLNVSTQLPADHTFTTGPALSTIAYDNGVYNFTVVLTTAGTQTLTIQDTANSTINVTSAGITVTAHAATKLVVTGLSNMTRAGVDSFTVTATDPYGNTDQSFSAPVFISLSDHASTIAPASYNYTAADKGFHQFTGATLKTAGPMTVEADQSLVGVNNIFGSTTFNLQPGMASHFTVTGFPTPITAGSQGTATVTALDTYNNVDINYSGTVLIGSSTDLRGTPALVPFPGSAQGVASLPYTFKTATVGTQTHTLGVTDTTDNDTVGLNITGSQSGIVVNPGPASTLVLSGLPPIVTRGVAYNFTVTAEDRFGNTATGYTGSVHFTSTDSAAMLPQPSSLMQGVGSFNVTFNTTGPAQSITVTDGLDSSITGTATSSVILPASKLVVTGYPSPQIAGVAGTFTVTAVDDLGNPVPNYSGQVQFASSAGSAANLPAPYQFNGLISDNGTHTFTLIFLVTGTQSVTVTDVASASITGTQTGIFVTPAPFEKFALAVGSPRIAGQAVNVTVTAEDHFGNLVPTYQGTVHFTSTDANTNAKLPGDYTFQPADNGVYTFTAGATFYTAGRQTLTATDLGSSNSSGQTFTVSSAAAASLMVTSTLLASVTAGPNNYSFTVTAFDTYGNKATGYTGTVNVSTDVSGDVLSPHTFTAADGGVYQFTVSLNLAGSRTLFIYDAGNNLSVSPSPNVTVNRGKATQFVFTSFSPTTVAAWTPTEFYLFAEDAGGNLDPTYVGSPAWSASQYFLPSAVVPGTPGYFYFNAQLGVVNQTGTLGTTMTLTVNDSVAHISGTTTITLIPALQISSITLKQLQATVADSFTVTAYNPQSTGPAIGYTGAFSFYSDDPGIQVYAGATPLPNNTYQANNPNQTQFSFNVKFARAGTHYLVVQDLRSNNLVSGIEVASATAPISHVEELPATSGPSITLTVTGTPSPVTQKAISTYDIYYLPSDSRSSSYTFLATLKASSPSFSFSGSAGVTYKFRSIAHDASLPIPYTEDDKSSGAYDTSTYIPILPVTKITNVTAPSDQTIFGSVYYSPFTIHWSGLSGDYGISKVDFYEIEDKGAATLLYTFKPTRTSVNYGGGFLTDKKVDGLPHTYIFYSVATDSQGNTETGEGGGPFSITLFDPDLSVAALEVQNGTQQRSYVRNVNVHFNEDMGIQDLIDNNKIRVTRFDMNGQNGVPIDLLPGTVAFDPDSPRLGNSLQFDFAYAELAGSSTLFGSAGLPDGRYQIAIDLPDGLTDTEQFFRLQGDVNGDGVVDKADLSLVNAALNSASTGLEDINGTGQVTVADRNMILRIINGTTSATGTSQAGNLVVAISDATIPVKGTGMIDVTVRSPDGITPEALQSLGLMLRISAGPHLLEFVNPQSDAELTTPDYVFYGNSVDQAGAVAVGNVSTTLLENDTYIGTDFTADGNNVTVIGNQLLLRLEVTADTSAPPEAGDTYTVSLVPGANSTLQDAAGNMISFTSPDGSVPTATLRIVPANNPVGPTIGPIADESISVGDTTGAIGFTVNDPQTDADNLVVTGSSSNPTLVPDANVVLGGSGAFRTVTVTPAPGQTGTATITLSATDDNGLSTQTTFVLTVTPPPLAQYLVAVVGGLTVTAGQGFVVTAQAADADGNPITSYNGPANVTATLTPAGSAGTFPMTVSMSSSGLGLLLASLPQAGSYMLTISDGTFSGSVGPITVTPGPAIKLAFASEPVNEPTGVPLLPVSVQVLDSYGNVVTSDQSDVVSLFVVSGPVSFSPSSTTTAVVHNGIATFNNLTLTTPGVYSLGEIVPGTFTGANSNSFQIAPLQVLPGSLMGSTSGFTLQFNAPILVNSVTPALYGSGFGTTAAVAPTVTLTQTTGTPPMGNTLPYQVPGSLVVNTATNSLTFVETDTASIVGSSTPLLPDGTYVVDLHSSGANGLQALYSGGGYLDGTNSGTPGHDFKATFTVSAAAAGDDVLWVPATADGPGLPLSAPGKNQFGGGYPVYLDDHSGSVTDVQATLSYNPALLNVTPTSTATFFVTVPTPGTAVLHYSGPALAAGTQTPIGLLSASVPSGTTSNPISYKAKDLLTLSGISLNGGAVAALGSEAVHLVAYVGDADGNGAYSSNDAVLITRVALQTDTGFAAYQLVDPVIVADMDGSGFIPADAALQANEAGVGFPTTNLPIPPIPGGAHFSANIYESQHLMEPVRNTSMAIDKAFAPWNAFPAAVLPVDLLMASSDLPDDGPTSLRHKRGSPLPSVALRPRVLDQFFASPSANNTAALLFPA